MFFKRNYRNKRILLPVFLIIITCLVLILNKKESTPESTSNTENSEILVTNDAENPEVHVTNDSENKEEESNNEALDNGVIDGGNAETVEDDIDKQSTAPDGSKLEVHFIDVGQGDASLIICNNEAMLIDAGDNSKGTTVQKYLKDHGISELKYIIGTHPDADHIGGLDVIIYKFTCDKILMPDATSDTPSYQDVLSSINSKGYKITTVSGGDIFTLGDASFEILSPAKGHPYEENNNNSIILRLDYYNNSFLFMADAEYQPQQVIYYDDELNAKADVVKVPHHGANSGYMKAFYDEVDPDYAVISVGKDNDYGHPHEKVLDDFKQRGVKVFRTDEQGTIVAVSDGNNITFNTEPSTSWAVGVIFEETKGPSDSSTKPDSVNEAFGIDVTYVLNTNSMKFHYPTCDSAKELKLKNRLELTCTREELLKEYPDAVPCKICNP